MATEYGDYYDPYGEGFTGKLGELSDGDNNDASGKSPNMPNRSIPKVEIKNSPTAEYGKYYLETFKSLGVLGSKGKRPDNTTPKNDMGQKSPNVVNPAVKKAANIAGETTVEDVLNAKEVAKLSGVSFLKSINKKDQKSPNVWNKKSNLSVTPAYGYHQSGLKKFLFEESAENILTSPNFIVTLNLVPFGFSNVSGLSSNIDTISK